MPRLDYAYCWNCEGHRDDVGPLSRSRLCVGCAEKLLSENIEGIASKSGPAYKRWRGGMISFAATLLAERPLTRS